ncbi:MAG: ABC transporter permease [Spirochaetota bacterium]
MNERYLPKFYHFLLVISASLKKNLLELIRYPINSIFVILFPIFWTLPIYLLIYSFAPDGVSQGLYSYTGTNMFFSYYLIGMIGGLFITQIFWGMGFSLKRLMDIGVLETIWSYPMDHIHFIVGESFYNLIETIYSEVASVLIIRYIFGFYLPKEFWQAFYIFIPFTIVMYGFGIFFAAFILQIKNPNTLVDLSSFVVMSLSGTQNPPQVFPRFLLAISLIMPTTYFIDYLRVISLKMKPLLPINLEIFIMSISLLILPLTGIIYFRFADKRCRKIGNIGVH